MGAPADMAASHLAAITSGTATSSDPASIAANVRGTCTLTITGVAPGDLVILEPPAALNAGLVYAGHVVTADTVTIQLGNIAVGAVDDTARVWGYVWYDRT